LGVELSGYGFYLGRRAESVRDDLKVRSLFLQAGDSGLVLMSADLIGFSVEFSDGLRRAVARSVHVPVANVLLACTHTHTGPATIPLPGIGEMDESYMGTLPDAMSQAARAAVSDAREASFSIASEAVEPIGFNRRTGTFDGIDPTLNVASFTRTDGKIFLMNYACHAVTLGRAPEVSADWPGAAVRAIEARGHRALLFQGFCGDIDPVTNLNRWGDGSTEDLKLYGEILAGRALKGERHSPPSIDTDIRSLEKRIRVPLAVPARGAIETQAAFFLEKNSGFPKADRFAAEWKKIAHDHYDKIAAAPYIDDVPVQAISVGAMKIIAFPAEVFSAYSLILKKEFPGLFTFGYANGDIGYLPSESAFADPGDYAANCAPMFYTAFPFTPDVPKLLVSTARELLEALQGKMAPPAD